MFEKFWNTIISKKTGREMLDDSSSPQSVIVGSVDKMSSGLEAPDYNAFTKKTLLLDVPDGMTDEVMERLSSAFEIVTTAEKGMAVDYVLSEYRMPVQVDSGPTKDDTSAKGTLKVRDEEFLSRAREVVKLNIDNTDFSKAGFALDMCMSQSLLYKKIKSLTGMSLVDFVRTIRMDYAMELLGDASLSISEIGERCGYASVSYFGEVFKKTYGKSPSEYRITPPHFVND